MEGEVVPPVGVPRNAVTRGTQIGAMGTLRTRVAASASTRWGGGDCDQRRRCPKNAWTVQIGTYAPQTAASLGQLGLIVPNGEAEPMATRCYRVVGQPIETRRARRPLVDGIWP